MIKIAIPKGRLLDDTIKLFKKLDINLEKVKKSRKLIFEFKEHNLAFLMVKPMDIPTYVEYGAADIGIAGKDVIVESLADVYEPLDLKFGLCRMVVAEPRNSTVKKSTNVRVATKYPNIAEMFFGKKGVPAQIIKLNGSVELAAVIGLCDKIVDLVETGRTLKENNLVEAETIFEVTARLIVNRASFKTNYSTITSIIRRLKEHL